MRPYYSFPTTFRQQNTDSQIIYSFIVSTVPVDGQAPSGAELSAGTVMIKLSPIYAQDKHLKSYLMKAEKLKSWISGDGWGEKLLSQQETG